MTVANATHLRWQQIQADQARMADYGKVIDDVWLVQHHHGPFTQRWLEREAETEEEEGEASIVHDVASGRVWDSSQPPDGTEPRQHDKGAAAAETEAAPAPCPGLKNKRPTPPCPHGWWDSNHGTCFQGCPSAAQKRDPHSGRCICDGPSPNTTCLTG